MAPTKADKKNGITQKTSIAFTPGTSVLAFTHAKETPITVAPNIEPAENMSVFQMSDAIVSS